MTSNWATRTAISALGFFCTSRPKAMCESARSRMFGSLMVFATTRWWADRGAVGQAGGLACSVPFHSADLAVAWVREQFSVPTVVWSRDTNGTLHAGLGATLV